MTAGCYPAKAHKGREGSSPSPPAIFASVVQWKNSRPVPARREFDSLRKLHVYIYMMNSSCRFCGRECPGKGKLAGHVPLCVKNPKSAETRKRNVESKIGKPLSVQHRENLAKTITAKVKAGEWHISFSKARRYDYRGIQLHGKWELAYAKYLDSMNIIWSRPNERFPYLLSGKIHFYTPDFYIPSEDVFIEIKGYETERDQAKWKMFPRKLKVIKGPELLRMGLIDSCKDV